MSAQSFTLADALTSLGVARAYIGDPFTADGLTGLPTEGEITASVAQEMNRLTAPELTGQVAHDAWITPGQITVTVPVIYTGAAQLAMLSATGSAHEGFTAPRRPTYTSLVLIPLAELDTESDPPTIAYDGTDWDPAPPTNALWFWKVVPQKPDLSMAWDNGGKIILPVTFEAFFATGAGYENIPNGQKVYTHGDPVEEGVTGILI